jgi:hypothetical protein
MTVATLQLVVEKFGRSDAGLVYGEVSLEVDGFSFPDPKWSDFVVVVLKWWCDALTRILRGDSGLIEVRFMEGPYLAELAAVNERALQLALIEAGLQRRILSRTVVETAPLVESVLFAAQRTLDECRNRGWLSRDADELAEARRQLQREGSAKLN